MTDRLKRLASVLKWRGNIYFALIQSLVLMMALFMFCRVVFFLYNQAFFPDMTFSRFALIMGGGLRFDLSAILYLNSLFILMMIIPGEWRFRSWHRKFLSWLFIFINAIGLAANICDTIYYEYTLRRTT